MEGIPIRNARRGDIPSMLLLWEAMMKELAQADARLAPHPRAREHRAAEFQRWLTSDRNRVVVAEEGGRLVVGFAAARILEGNGWQEPKRLGRIVDLFVVRPRRRRGIGRRLTGRLLDLLREEGIETVRLSVSARGEGAMAFWASMGWEQLDVVMAKEVQGAEPEGGGS